MAGHLVVTVADYRFLLVDASTGYNIGEIPLTVSSFSRVLNGVGQLSGTLPLDHPLATTANLQGDREITVLRNNAPIWNGPITYMDASFSTRTINLTAREPVWYFSKRTLEVDKNYNADLYYIWRNLFTYATTKKSTAGDGMTGGAGTNINAALPRFSVSPASGNSGTSKALRISGAARMLILDLWNDLVADPTTGLDYRMDYSTGSTRQSCQRTLTIGSPSLGSTLTPRVTEHVIYDFTKTEDRERAANRVHTIGKSYTYTLQNASSILTAGDILIESVFDRSDTSSQSVIQNFTRDARRRSIPPVASYAVSYVPTAGALDYGWCNVGDTINLQIGGATVLHSVGNRRVVQIDVQPPSGQSPEIVTLTLNIPLDQLGT